MVNQEDTGLQGELNLGPDLETNAPFQEGTGTGEIGDPFHTTDVGNAIDLLLEGKHVRLEQESQVGTLLSQLRSELQSKGEDLSDLDLCQVSVTGTNLFCGDHIGKPRIAMPQMAGPAIPGSIASEHIDPNFGEANVGPLFVDFLVGKGVRVERTTILASELRASQMELIGPKVLGISLAVEDGTLPPSPIFVTRDSYILDGHHRWAGTIASDLITDNDLGDLSLDVFRIDMPVSEILPIAEQWTTDIGMVKQNTAVPDDLSKRRLLKHTPGGVQHDQEEHGNWSEGSNEDGGAQSPSALDEVAGEFASDDEGDAGRSVPSEKDYGDFVNEWPVGSWDPEVHALTQDAQRRVFDRMSQDPRWADALSEWHQQSSDVWEVFEQEGRLAEEIRADLHSLANEMYGDDYWNFWGGTDDDLLWSLRDRFNEAALVVKSDSEFLQDDGLFIGDAGDSMFQWWTGGNYEDIEGSGGWFSTKLNEFVEEGPLALNPNLSASEDYEKFLYTDDAYLIEQIDEENDLALLSRQGSLGQLFAGTETSRLLNPEFIGSPESAFGPSAGEWVPLASLFHDDMLTEYAADVFLHGGPVLFTEDGYWEALDAIDGVEGLWGDFESNNGNNPADFLALLEMGEAPGGATSIEAGLHSLVVNDSYEGSGIHVGDPRVPQEVPFLMRTLWSNTAADDHPWALATQMAAAKEFGIDDFQIRTSHIQGSIDVANEIATEYDDLLGTWARAVYDETQAELAKRGWDLIPVARGMGTQEAVTDAWERVQGDLNPLSSWSVRPDTAVAFTPNQYGSTATKTVLRGWVPREQVWGMSLTGNGSVKELEVILLGGEDSFDGEVFHTGDRYKARMAFGR
jgi:hypothetical protein